MTGFNCWSMNSCVTPGIGFFLCWTISSPTPWVFTIVLGNRKVALLLGLVGHDKDQVETREEARAAC